MRRGLPIALSVLSCLVSACAGTSTGNPAAPDGEGPDIGNEGGGNCDRKIEPLDGLDHPSPLGFSAADMLALTDHGEVAIEWRDPGSSLTYGPESGRGTLQLTVTPRDKAPRFVDRRPRTSGSGAEIGSAAPDIATECGDLVELDVSVRLTTGGGAFDERFDAVLSAFGPRVANLYVSTKAEDLAGSFHAELNQPPGSVLESVMFSIAFSEFGSKGDLSLGFEQPESSGNAASRAATASASILRWPAGVECEGFAIPLDHSAGDRSAQAATEQFNAAAMQLKAPGISATPLYATFRPSGATACAVDVGDPNAAGPSLELAGTLEMRSEDGRVDGQWTVGLRASSESVRVAHDLRGSLIATLVDPSEFESTFGIHGIDVSGYDQAGILFSLEVGPAAAVSGELTVHGAKNPNCPPPPPPSSNRGGSSAPGCPGITFVPLWTATIEAQP